MYRNHLVFLLSFVFIFAQIQSSLAQSGPITFNITQMQKRTQNTGSDAWGEWSEWRKEAGTMTLFESHITLTDDEGKLMSQIVNIQEVGDNETITGDVYEGATQLGTVSISLPRGEINVEVGGPIQMLHFVFQDMDEIEPKEELSVMIHRPE